MDDGDESSVGGVQISSAFRLHLDRQLGIETNEGGASVSSPTKTGQSAAYVAEIQRLRDTLAAMSSTSQGPIEAKYLEQVKKNRDVVVKLEAERAKVAKLTARIVVLEKEKIDQQDAALQTRALALPSQRGGGSNGGGASNARIGALEEVPEPSVEEKLEKANRAVQLQRKTIEDLRREATKMRRVLQLEIGGDEDAVDAALKNFGDTMTSSTTTTPVTAGQTQPTAPTQGWKGRAQQISILKGKVKDLERALRQTKESAGDGATDGGATSYLDQAEVMSQRTGYTVRTALTTTTGGGARDFDDVNRSVVEFKQKKIQTQVRDVQMRLEEKTREAEEDKRRAESLQARLLILERDNQHLKNCLCRIVEKTENDDKLIAAYKAELEEKRVEMRRVMTAGGVARSGSYHDNNALTLQVERLERENARLLDTMSDLRRSQHVDRSAAVTEAWGTEGTIPEAMYLIESQRKTILALESQLQKRDKVSSSHFETAKGCDDILREENTALKFRVKAISEMMEKEIAVHEAMAAQRVAAVQITADIVAASLEDHNGRGDGVSLPPITSRPNSTHSNASRKGSQSKQPSGGKRDSITAASGAASNIRQEDFENLKKQYDELKRAFNSQQTRALK